MRLKVAVLLSALVLCGQAAFPQTPNDAETQESCRKFVQDFYAWYLKLEKSSNGSAPSSTLAINKKPEAFTAELVHRLKEDQEAQDNSPGELVGLDFDPFLNSQDPSPRFSIVSVTRKGVSYWVDVYGMDSGKRQEHVVPELVQQSGHWVFVNFHYGKSKWSDDENLLSTLKSLREERAKNP